MSTASAAVDELAHSPQLPRYVEYLQEMLADEKRRREQFYEEIDEDTKAEFINGEIVMHSPVRLEHLHVVNHAVNLLLNYVVFHRLGQVFTEKCLIRCERNDYEPDICFFGVSKSARMKRGQKLFPPPDLIVEVLSPSTVSNDRDLKFHDYAHHGVSEYWIIDADERYLEQYVLTPGATSYVLHSRVKGKKRLTSIAIPGFEVPCVAIFNSRENQRAMLALLQPE